MNNRKSKILQEKSKDDEGVTTMLWRLRKLGFLPKFWILDIQVMDSFIING